MSTLLIGALLLCVGAYVFIAVVALVRAAGFMFQGIGNLDQTIFELTTLIPAGGFFGVVAALLSLLQMVRAALFSLALMFIVFSSVPFGWFPYEHDIADSIFLSGASVDARHVYLAVNRLRCIGPDTDPGTVLQFIEHDLTDVFPIVAAGDVGKEVVNGNIFRLGISLGFGNNPVTSTLDAQGHSFLLTADPTHWLAGKVHQGIAPDAQGGRWLFQFGLGPDGPEGGIDRLLTYPLAARMWPRMAHNVDHAFNPRCTP